MEFDLRNSQLFLDDAIIEQSVRLQRVMHQPHKYFDNPVSLLSKIIRHHPEFPAVPWGNWL